MATTTMQSTDAQDSKDRHLPGEIGVWVFIFGDLIVFALLFLVFLYYKGHEPTLFAESQRHMSQVFAAANTFLMLTSSWLVAMSVQATRRNDVRFASTGLKLAFLCGATFALVKYFEWGEHIRDGFTLGSNHFFQCYYMFTGIHLGHVLLGMTMLFLMTRKLSGNRPYAEKLRFLEAGATFWHMVDLLWIILFALFYLVK